VASFTIYREAERAVDLLSDRGFPVERIAIVGRDLQLVEQVTGRMGYGQAALRGALQGAVLGLLFGWLFGLFNWIDPVVASFSLAFYGLVFGAVVGALLGLLTHAMTGGRRDFASVGGVRANQYDVMVDDEFADEAVRLLRQAGVQYVRGFALNSTHYVSTASDIEFGSKIAYELKRRGLPLKHFVINTAQNGAPFTWGEKRTSNFDNSPVCKTKTETRCVTLGIPPTTDVANPKWHLSALNQLRAKRHVDGYLWYGRPWLYMQSDPFSMTRALWLARTTPY
jgi:hypothetical protein